MDNLNWPGFDPRKICPRCGTYQTHIWISKRVSTASKRSLLWLVLANFLLFFLLPGVAFFAVFKGGALDPYQFVGLLFAVLVALILILIIRRIGPALKKLYRISLKYLNFSVMNNGPLPVQESNNDSMTVYRLRCSNCGYRWQKSKDEWEFDISVSC